MTETHDRDDVDAMVPLDKSIDTGQLTSLASDIEQFLTDSDNQAKAAAAERLEAQRSLIQRFVPNAVQKAADAALVGDIETAAAHRAQMLDIHAAVLLHRANQEANAVLAANGMKLTEQLHTFSLAVSDALSRNIERAKEVFNERMLEAWPKLERYRSVPQLYERNLRDLERENELYFRMLDEMRDQFLAALRTRLDDGGSA